MAFAVETPKAFTRLVFVAAAAFEFLIATLIFSRELHALMRAIL